MEFREPFSEFSRSSEPRNKSKEVQDKLVLDLTPEEEPAAPVLIVVDKRPLIKRISHVFAWPFIREKTNVIQKNLNKVELMKVITAWAVSGGSAYALFQA